MKKRLLSLCITFLLLALLVPMKAEAATVVSSGQLQDSYMYTYWKLYDDGSLVFTGNCNIPNYSWDNNLGRPNTSWHGASENSGTPIKSITFDGSFHSIGKWAFAGLEELESVTFNDSIWYIPEGAFDRCAKLQSVTLPSSLYSIGYLAFAYCDSLETITILSTDLGFIDSGAFKSCSSLTAITVPEDSENYASVDGVLFNKAMTTLIKYPAGKTDSSYTVPSTVKSISDFSYASNLTSITFPEGLTSFGSSAFEQCTGLTSISIPDGVKTIPFNGFWGCTGLRDVKLPASLTTIDDQAFYNCWQIRNITFPEGLKTIGLNAFYNNRISNIVIPASVTTIDSAAFSSNSTTKMTVLSKNCSFADRIFSPYNDRVPEIHGWAGSTAETYAATYNATFTEHNPTNKIATTAEPTCTTLGVDLYDGCDCGIETTVYIDKLPHSMTNKSSGYRSSAATCKSPAKYYVQCDNCTTRSTTITVDVGEIDPNGHNFSDGVCTDCGIIGGKCGYYLYWSYDGEADLLTIYGSDTMYGYSTSSYAPWYTYRNEIKTVNMIGGSSIGSYAFQDMDGLTQVTLPEGLTSIGNNAFVHCGNLETITMPSTVSTLNSNAFQDCAALTAITLPEKITTIQDGVFLNCKNLETVEILGAVTAIGTNAFGNCSSLEGITIPDNVTRIGDMAFQNCTSLTQVTIPSGVTTLSYNLFAGCKNLADVTFTGDITTVSSMAFTGCVKLTQIDLPDSVTSIQESAFSMSGLTSFTFPENVTAISDGVLSSCANLETLVIPAGVTGIADNAFSNCDKIADVYFGGTSDAWEALGANRPSATRTHYNTTDPENHWTNETHPATCVAAGYTVEICPCDETYQRNLTETDPALGHNWISVQFNWAEDYSTCSVDLECDRDGCDATDNKDCQVSSETYTAATCQEQNSVAYTARYDELTDSQTVYGENGPHKFVDGACEHCGACWCECINTVPDGYTPITNAIEFFNIRYALDGKYILMNDIDLSEVTWASIGYDSSSSAAFTGVLDGNGFSVHMNLTTSTTASALVWENKGTIMNLTTKGSVKSRADGMGVLCRSNSGTILNCHNQATASFSYSTTYGGSNSFGGIAGSNSGTIRYCSNQADITGSAQRTSGYREVSANVGGIAGGNYGTIQECWNTGTVHAVGYYAIAYAGGISGGVSYRTCSFIDCYNAGTVKAEVASGSQHATPVAIVIVDTSAANINIINCYNCGSLYDESTLVAGKLASSVSGATITYKNCYYPAFNNTGSTISGVTALSSTQMAFQSSYYGFDFENVWIMEEYPVLRSICTHQVRYHSEVTPTCTADGKIAYYHCGLCNRYFTDSDKTTELSIADLIDPSSHSFTNYVSQNDATCKADGTKIAKCDHCDETDVLPDEGSMLKHNWVSVKFNWAEDHSTCTVDLECDRENCDATDNKDCQVSSKSFTATTCQEQSYVAYTATYESFTDFQKVMGRFGDHSFTDYVPQGDATCKADGTKIAKCDHCEETDVQPDTGSKLEHNWVAAKFIWAEDYSTCSLDLECDREDCDATDNKDCQVSSKSFTATTCREQSYVAYTATYEDFADIQKIMGRFGNHSFTDYVPQGDATCKADGTKIAKCDHCEETDVLPDEGSMLKHNWIAVKFTWAEDYSTCSVDLECDREDCDATGSKDCQVSSESFTATTCQEQSYVAYTATYENFTDFQKIMGRFGDHSFTDYVPQGDATCKADGTKIAKCDHCEETDVLPDEGSKLEHSWTNATCTAPKTCEKCGTTEGTALSHPFVDGKCTVCGADDPNYVPPVTDPDPTEPEPTEPVATEPKPTEPEATEPEVTEPKPTEPAPTEPDATQNVTRLAGDDRFETSFLVAEEMKQVLGVSKFDAIVLASGRNFADALSGSYLAAVKHAPILLGYKGEYNRQTILYIQENLAPNGIVYILGGEKAVVTEFDAAFASLGIHYERLAGADRFETNLMVLREAGINPGDEILVCTGTDFADSLSGSATGLPILLVYKKLTDNQKAYLANVNSNSFCIVGGESAVSGSIEQAISAFGPVDRLAGSNRLLTSVLVAQRYFGNPDSAVVAYGWNFPDGLCGGPLAYTMGSPLILTHYSQKHYAVAADYASGQQIRNGYILGGDGLVGDDATRAIFSMDPQQAILSK